MWISAMQTLSTRTTSSQSPIPTCSPFPNRSCAANSMVSSVRETNGSPGAARFFYGLVVDRIVTVEVKSVNITEIAPVSVKLSLVGFEQGPVQDIGMVLVANGYAVPSVFSLPLYEEASYMPHPPPDENPFRMMPICVQNDGVVVGQVDGIQEELEDLMDKVQNLCKRNTSHPRSCNELKKGQPCCAKFFEDNLWYRAVVDSTVDDKALVG